MQQHRLGHFEHVARELQHDRARRAGMRREPHRHRRPRGDVGLVDQPHRQFRVAPLLVRRVHRVAQVLVGENAQQRRPDVDALAVEIEEALEARWCGEIYHRATPGNAAPVFSEN